MQSPEIGESTSQFDEAVFDVVDECACSMTKQTSEPEFLDVGDVYGVPVTNVTSCRRSSDGRKEKKGKSERSENSSVVIGLVDTIEKFQELLDMIGSSCGPVRSHYFRAYQQCGFIYFHEEETATKTKQSFDGFEFCGQTLKACAPLSYFDNELDARPIPPDSARRASKELTINIPSSTTEEGQQRRASDVASAGEPSCTLVLKNLNFNLKQEKLLELLSQMGIPPQSVNYHYDQNGNFCGIAFAKYKKVEDAAKALEQIAGLEIGKRKVRVEYKRSKSVVPSPSRHQSRQGSLPTNNILDPTHMDAEQKQIMDQLLQFIGNHEISELSFPSSLTISQRSHVHIIAEYLGLYHMTDEENELRVVVVSKIPIKDDLPRKPRLSLNEGTLQGVGKGSIPGRGTVVRNTWPREHNVQPRGPDGGPGFSFGRGRRVSTPATLPSSVPRFNPSRPIIYPVTHVGRLPGLASGDGSSALKASVRSASVPFIPQTGIDFQ